MKNNCWPLYGNGIEYLGKNEAPDVRELPKLKQDEILVRHDAVGLCFTDLKEIIFGNNHPRLLGRDLNKNPIIPGHELCLTIIEVGEKYKNVYVPGERYTIQPDCYYKGKSIPFSFGRDGAYAQYSILGKTVLEGDEGSYLIKIPENMSYAGAALTEPWACVEASYTMKYRNHIKENGKLWIVSSQKESTLNLSYEWKSLFKYRPNKIIVSNLSEKLSSEISLFAQENKIEFISIPSEVVADSNEFFDDIIFINSSEEILNKALARLANNGIFALVGPKEEGKIKIDVGRLHYDNILIVGTNSISFQEAYNPETRVKIKKDGILMVLGAGGPMGMMHLQRAIEAENHPRIVVAVNRNPVRLNAVKEQYEALAKRKGISLICLNPVKEKDVYEKEIEKIMDLGGFDDIEVMITNLKTIEENFYFLSKNGVMNLFAGIKKGNFVELNLDKIKGISNFRILGHSGSGLKDQIEIIDKFKENKLEPRRAAVAIGGFKQFIDGVKAMKNSTFPGKIIIYPFVPDFPLTSIKALKEKVPEVYKLLEDGKYWTKAAEEKFLEEFKKNSF